MTDFRFDAVTVLGAGTMGRGIAQVSAATGSRVILVDQTDELAAAGKAAIAASLDRAVSRGRVTAEAAEATLAAIDTASDPAAAVAAADVVVEAAPEKLELKRSIFAMLADAAPAHSLLGTNTSSLPIGDIATDNPAAARIVGLHFFNPVPAMKLVEIIHAEQTAPDTLQAARDYAERLGKEPIVVRDVPGFATSRLGVLLGLEAIRMVEQEVASPTDIDKAMELGYRHPMGPLRLTDLVGLDVRLAIADHLQREQGTDTFAAPQLLRDMVAAGKLGKKSGVGFYRYDD